MRRLITWAIVGSFFGSVIATLIAPSVLQTLLATTGAKDAMCQCMELVNRTATLLIQTQLWGAAIGGAVFPAAAWLLRRRFGSKELPPAATPPAPVETR